MGLFQRRKDVSIAISSTPDGSLLRNRELPALENSSFWSCVTSLCSTFATLPLHAYRSKGGSRTVSCIGVVPRLLEHPCPYMTKTQWRWVMTFNFELYGKAMAIVERTGMGDPMALYPVAPSMMSSVWHEGRLFYQYAGTGEKLPAADVFVAYNTPVGYTSVLSPVAYADKDLDVAGNSKMLQTNYFKRGTTIGGVLTVPRNTPADVKEQLKAVIQGSYSGLSNAYKTMILEDNMKYEPIRLSETDSKKLAEAQAWTLQEVARRFRVPPFFIGDLTKATFANSEQQGTQLVIYALQPRAVAWEDAWGQLCADGEYVKFSLAGLMRGDHAARAAFYHNALMDGWMSINEVRALEDLNPIADGDSHYFPMNYTTIDKIGKNEPTGFPADQWLSKESCDASSMIEKRRKDLAFLESTRTVTKSSRAQIESIIRRQLKAEIAELRKLVADEQTASGVIAGFGEYAKSIEAGFGDQYAPVYEGIMSRLLPLLQKEIGTANEVSAESMKAYAGKYASSMSGRHAAMRVSDVAKALRDLESSELDQAADDLADHWLDVVPADESTEETARAGNAFNVFLMGGLGISFMHVVASPDSCEFCSGLDGQVCEVNGVVLAKGAEVTDGEGNTRTIHKNFKHPPWHVHCHCGVAPGR